MREIKFRLWDKVTHRMYSPSNVAKLVIAGGIANWSELGTTTVELLQYTGLKDKNGKEIYEGDIVKLFCCKEYYIAEIFWDRCSFLIRGEHWDKHTQLSSFETGSECEIIGNIYENPELLKETQ
jgi:hypothetical protein